MRQLSFFLFMLCLVWPVAARGGEVLSVTVSGLEGELSRNVLASLRIHQARENGALSVNEIRRLHRRAEADIVSALEPLGYYSAKVEGSLIHSEGIWQASYLVSPGEPVRVRSVTIEASGPGKGLSLFADLKSQMPLQEGDILHHQQYEEGKKKILQWAVKNGFIEAGWVENEIRVYSKEFAADIVLLLDTGHRFLFGQTTVNPLNPEIISPELLARYLPYTVGEPYSQKGISELQAILYGTGFFSRVTIEPELDKVADLRVPIGLTLEPAKRNRYSFGLGYGTDTGARGKMEWRNRLLNASGHRAHGLVQISQSLSRVEGDYEVPVADPRYDQVTYAGSYGTEEWDGTKTDLLSVAAAASHDGPRFHYGVGLELQDENYSVGVTDGSSLLLMPGGNWSMVVAENRINTENGWRFSVDGRGATESILADATFVQAQAGIKAILSPVAKWRLIGRATLGGTLVDSIDDLPPSLRFYAGGDQSVRGYGYKQIGPKDASGTVIGGRYLMVGGLEVERVIDELWSVAAFYDTGQVANSYDAIALKKSVGVGGRLTLPFGQVRLDIAAPLLDDEQSGFRIHIVVGADL